MAAERLALVLVVVGGMEEVAGGDDVERGEPEERERHHEEPAHERGDDESAHRSVRHVHLVKMKKAATAAQTATSRPARHATAHGVMASSGSR